MKLSEAEPCLGVLLPRGPAWLTQPADLAWSQQFCALQWPATVETSWRERRVATSWAAPLLHAKFPESNCSLGRVQLCDPMDCVAGQASLSFTISRSLLKLCPPSPWCHPTTSSSVAPFSFYLQFFPASGSFPTSCLFISGGQSIGASVSASVLPMNIQGWFPLRLTGLIFLLSKRLSRVFSSTTVQKH